MPELKKALGGRFRALRKKAGLSQEQLAELLGIDPNSISRIECGVHYPALDTLERVAAILKVEMRDFFLFSQEESIEEMRSFLVNLAQISDAEDLRSIYQLVQNHVEAK